MEACAAMVRMCSGLGCDRRGKSRCDHPLRTPYFVTWYANAMGSLRRYQLAMACLIARPQEAFPTVRPSVMAISWLIALQ